jgi:hypothetical protein
MDLSLVNNPAVRHVANNLNIFGFGSEEGALIQCIKELGVCVVHPLSYVILYYYVIVF